jgi:hypothetical protein
MAIAMNPVADFYEIGRMDAGLGDPCAPELYTWNNKEKAIAYLRGFLSVQPKNTVAQQSLEEYTRRDVDYPEFDRQ